jgi:nucleotide-binding universal stress UspA family protein
VIILAKLKILVPLDGSERSKHSIAWIKKLYKEADTKVTLLNVMELFFTDQANISPEDIDIVKHNVQQALDLSAKELEGYEVDTLIRTGDSSERILETAKEGGYDVIVMTRSGKSGIYKALGSVTTAVAKHSEIPVFVIPN